jgi:hypothetical protein
MSSVRKASIVSDPTKGVKVDASVVAQSFREEIKSKVQKLKEQGIGEFAFFVACYCNCVWLL